MKYEACIYRAQKVLQYYPQSRQGHRYITLKDGRKVFLNRFIRKYGLDGRKTMYGVLDLKRRISMIEFFDYFTQLELRAGREKTRLLLESEFFRMVILKIKVKRGNRYELLSFYPL